MRLQLKLIIGFLNLIIELLLKIWKLETKIELFNLQIEIPVLKRFVEYRKLIQI